MTRSALFAGAGVIVVVIALVKRIEPLVEVGVALVVIAMISNSKPKP